MASNSDRSSGSSGRSAKRKRVVIGASETTRVNYAKNKPQVHTERRTPPTRGTSSSRSTRGGGRGAGQSYARSKREERERRQRQTRFRTWGIAALVVAVLAGVAVGAVALYRSELFAVRTVSADGGRELSPERITEIAAIPADETLLRLDTEAAERRLLENPWVAEASVERDFPSTVQITIVERTPGAVVRVDTERWVVATDGTWLRNARSGVPTPTPVTIVDVPDLAPAKGARAESPQLQNAIAAIDGVSEELRGSVETVVAEEIDTTTLVTTDDVEIVVGRADDMARKDEIARRILAEQGGAVVYINVRTTDRPTWRGLPEGP